MGDMGDIFREMTKRDKKRRTRNLQKARDDGLPWIRHTEYHWSMDLLGDRLDYWPSKNKFRWRNKTRFGGIAGFIKNQLEKEREGAK
jgi:hypothetical protein